MQRAIAFPTIVQLHGDGVEVAIVVEVCRSDGRNHASPRLEATARFVRVIHHGRHTVKEPRLALRGAIRAREHFEALAIAVEVPEQYSAAGILVRA